LLGIEFWWTWVQAESGRCRFKNISHTTGVMGVLEFKRNQVDIDLKTFLTLQAL